MKIIIENSSKLNSTIKNTILNRNLVILLFLFTGLTGFAQDAVLLQGKIEAANNDLEKIHVINMNLEQGSVTNKNGEFDLRVRLNDTLYFSSVQFENRSVVVNTEMFKNGKLEVELSERMNELAEVVIDDINLSGYLANDIAKISTEKFQRNYRLQSDLGAVIARDRELNPYEQAFAGGGVRFDILARKLADKLSEDKKQQPVFSKKDIMDKSLQLVGYQFFEKQLGLTENEVSNFLYFCSEDRPKFKNIVLNNNALVLIEYFETRIEEFRDRRGKLLNQGGQIPG
ncbi:carboxypeptidase-like regulatory domain-containing protein [Gramella sp. GC03-9]|uniref:Carboxypeptidase-like regulatory domain-containing protein n=1 Tax=Christiangramia oceanisediminis TaxID=2920386 RepID=A0A9X2KZW8_9FLAO|nr:carboxypeptidase-like regulatory domain-containing protein [Gramella oceanisediminis]MCP9201433.1 carboxypeptidase-like regulatory domain-containing protein [Gramella oceanisediminis]